MVNWFERAKGMVWAPERGERCTACLDMRFARTALYAHENPVITARPRSRLLLTRPC
jgi:predicted adenine nucleotide alpha hydrolase (AANH) superfamily ATPase